MTTVAYKDGIIAYDSRMVSGTTIVDDNYDKHQESKGVHFFFSGCVCEQKNFLAAYQGEAIKSENNATAIVCDKGELYMAIFNKGEYISVTPENKDRALVLGSGEDYALTAMDMGATAKEAIKWAMKRDTGTGGRIRTFKV
jgi:ATP-dependent protease HslVU (ClpYQ) peptidase subunit